MIGWWVASYWVQAMCRFNHWFSSCDVVGTRIKSVYVKLDLRTYIIGTWWMGVLSLSSSIIFLMPPTPPYYPIFIFCLGNLILVWSLIRSYVRWHQKMMEYQLWPHVLSIWVKELSWDLLFYQQSTLLQTNHGTDEPT